MEDYPKTLLEFERQFGTEVACIEYLFKLRWPEGFRYPRCGRVEVWRMRRDLYRCAHCRTESSVTSGTIFQDTRKPLQVWFHAIWHLTSQKYGANALGLQRVLDFGFNRRTSRSRGKLFYRLVQQSVTIAPLSGRDLRAPRARSQTTIY